MGLLQTISNLWRRPPEKLSDGSYFYSIASSKAKNFDYLEAFSCVPEVNAVINLDARCFSNGRILIVDANGKQIAHEYSNLLKSPNWYQPAKEFARQAKLFRDITGNEYLFTLKPIGMDTVKALFVLPSHLVTCEYLADKPFFLFTDIPEVKYSVDIGSNRKMPLAHEDIIHMNDNRVSINSCRDKSLLLGESKLKALAQPISNLYHAYESRGVILRHRGGVGILSPEHKDALGTTIPMEDDEKTELHDQFRKMYGTLSDQRQIIISKQSLRWQPIEIDPRKLGLFEETAEDFAKIKDAYGVPQELFSREDGATYENMNNARKGLYENSVIPEAQEWISGINQSLFEDDEAKAIVDYSHLPIFQEDKKADNEAMNTKVTYLSRLFADGAITLDEYREEIIKAGIGKKSVSMASKSIHERAKMNGHAVLT